MACDQLGEDAVDDRERTKNLFELIDLLREKGFITRDLHDSSHEIRAFGNYGAHIQNDGLDAVTAEDAADVRSVTWQFLHSIYVAPSETRRLRERRQGKAERS